MKRSEFLKISTLSFVFPPLNGILSSNLLHADQFQVRSIIKPKRLKPKSRVGIISPASFVTEEEYELIEKNLNDLDLIAIHSKNLFKKLGYLAGNDFDRVADLHEMFSREDIDGIMCTRGGYGTPRILRLINYDLIKRNPKVLIGYSDITSLLIAIFTKTGLVTFHGPVGISTFNDFTKKYFYEILFKGTDYLEFEFQSEESSNSATGNSSIEGILKISGGRTEGILIGGNLSLIISSIGTEFDFDPADKILFIEEVGEEPYRIDRMFTQLINSRKLEKSKAIILGKFSNCEVRKENPGFKESFNLREVLIDRLSNLGIPVIYGLPFGHIKDKYTLPIGTRAMIDVDNEKFALIESAVI